MKTIRRHSLALLLLACVALVATPTVAQDHVPVGTPVPVQTKQVRLLLSHVHEVPSRQALEGAATNPKEILREIANDRAAGFMRDRALMALGHFADGQVWSLYASILNDDDAREATRHKVMLRAAEVFSEASLELIVPFLSHHDPQLRLTAVAALDSLEGDQARQAIAARVDAEESEIVREAMVKALRTVR